MRVNLQAHGYEQIEAMLKGLETGRDKYEDAALVAGAKVLKAKFASMSSPRSKGRSRNPRGHMLDHVRYTPPEVVGTGKSIEIGAQIKYGDGFAYAPIVERRKAFFIPTFNATADAQIEAMIGEIRKGLGLND